MKFPCKISATIAPIKYLLLLFIILTLNTNASAGDADTLETRLPNGLKVIIKEDTSAPVVALQMWVRVGSADESDAQAGIAHVFEHMLFKGTKKRKVGEIAKAVESSGGYINAYTSYDHTVYHLVVASRYFSTGLDVLSDAIMNSSFDPAELKKELEVVMEELRRGEDNPARKLFKTLMDKAYTTHPYRRPVIGSQETVKGFSRDDILSFFNKWYIPNNMTLVVAGDIKKEVALKAVKETLGAFERNAPPHVSRTPEPVQGKARSTIITQPIAESKLAIGFHIPALKDKDVYALDLLSVIMGQGQSSRLYRDIKLKRELVHSVTASSMTPKDPGLFIINCSLEADKIQQTVGAIYDLIKRLYIEGPTPEEMKRAKLALESSFIYERENMEGKASQLGYYDTVSGSLSFEDSYIRGVFRVTPSQIQRTIAKYLKSSNMTTALILNTDAQEMIDTEELSKVLTDSGDILSFPQANAQKEGTTKKLILKNGITLLMRENHSNPTVSIYANFPGGLRSETTATNGLGFFTSSILTKGTKQYSRIELARKVEGLAGSVDAFSGRNTTGIKGTFLAKDLAEGLDILSEVLLNFTAPPYEIDKLKKDVISAIKRRADNLPSHTLELLQASLFAPHPYAMPVMGRPETVRSFTREMILKHAREHFKPDNMVIAIVGDFDSNEATEKVKSLFANMRAKGSVTKDKPARTKKARAIRTVTQERDKAQTNIAIGFLSTTIDSKDKYALAILDEILSGQGGRLFMQLRDSQSLAYSVSAFSRPGVDPGLFGVYIGSSPAKSERAIKEILRILKEVRKDGVTPTELKRAKRSIIGSYEIGLQDNASQSANMAINELLGLGYGYSELYPNKINAVTKEDVLRITRKYLRLDRYTISIVGPQAETTAPAIEPK